MFCGVRGLNACRNAGLRCSEKFGFGCFAKCVPEMLCEMRS